MQVCCWDDFEILTIAEDETKTKGYVGANYPIRSPKHHIMRHSCTPTVIISWGSATADRQTSLILKVEFPIDQPSWLAWGITDDFDRMY